MSEPDEISKEEFCARFKAEMLRLVGPTYVDADEDGREIEGSGNFTADYADKAGPTYWENPDQRAEGPEDCAATDYSYWE